MSRFKTENADYLSNQIITYLGNKRSLLTKISHEIHTIQRECGKNDGEFITCDLFSGSGIVARRLKEYSSLVYSNDLEVYSRIINECYLSNPTESKLSKIKELKSKLDTFTEENYRDFSGIITQNYAPKDEDNIQELDRVFYTIRNAKFIDCYRYAIDEFVPDNLKCYFIAPLLYEASVHTNTSGVFKGFYKSHKDSNNKQYGKFGGEGENALERIRGEVCPKLPIFSNFTSKFNVFQEDANTLVKSGKMQHCDIVYIDPPYNQHQYGSNYHMLTTIANNALPCDVSELSKVAGIPTIWNKSKYCQKSQALNEFKELIQNIDSDYIIVSYNNEGHISDGDLADVLNECGEFIGTPMEFIGTDGKTHCCKSQNITYDKFKGGKKMKDEEAEKVRSKKTKEMLFTIKKR